MKMSPVKQVGNDAVVCCVLWSLSESACSYEGRGQALQSRLVWNQQIFRYWAECKFQNFPLQKWRSFQVFSQSRMAFWNCCGFISSDAFLLLPLYHSSYRIFFLFFNYWGELWLTLLPPLFFFSSKSKDLTCSVRSSLAKVCFLFHQL